MEIMFLIVVIGIMLIILLKYDDMIVNSLKPPQSSEPDIAEVEVFQDPIDETDKAEEPEELEELEEPEDREPDPYLAELNFIPKTKRDVQDHIMNRLDQFPQIKFTLNDDIIEVPVEDDSGFTVRIEWGVEYHTVCYNIWHHHIPADDMLSVMMEFYMGLCSRCRVTEFRRDNIPYRAVVDFNTGGECHNLGNVRFMRWNFWCRPEKRILKNSFLPKEDPGGVLKSIPDAESLDKSDDGVG